MENLCHMIRTFYTYPKKENTCKPQKFSHKLFNIGISYIFCAWICWKSFYICFIHYVWLPSIPFWNQFNLLCCAKKTMDFLGFFVNQMRIMYWIACNWNIKNTMTEPNSCFRVWIISIFHFWLWTFKMTKTFIYREKNAKNNRRKQTCGIYWSLFPLENWNTWSFIRTIARETNNSIHLVSYFVFIDGNLSVFLLIFFVLEIYRNNFFHSINSYLSMLQIYQWWM